MPNIIAARQPAPNERLADLLAKGIRLTGLEPTEKGSYQQAQRFANLLGWTPLGIPQAAYDAGQMMGSGAEQGSPTKIGAGAILGALAAMPEVKKGITAYHGSPYMFDKFDLSKIGTGEGAQSYGHGLYFAENEATAKSYRDALKWKGTDWSAPVKSAAFWLENFGGDPERTQRYLESVGQKIKETPQFYGPNAAAENDAAIAAIKSGDAKGYLIGATAPMGHMYQVHIAADPEHFLDWDAGLHRQSQHVQDALASFGIKADPAAMRAHDDALLAALNSDSVGALPKQPWDPTGGLIYESPKIVPGSYRDQPAASAALLNAGIPGIKYLDQGSRAAGDGTRNYVVFNPDTVSILKRYAIPAGAGATAVGSMLGSSQPDQSGQY